MEGEEEKKYTNKNDVYIPLSAALSFASFVYFISWIFHTLLAKLLQPRPNPRPWSVPR